MVRDTFRQSLATRLFWVMLGLTALCTLFCLGASVTGDERREKHPDELPLYMPKSQATPEVQKEGIRVAGGEVSLGFGLFRFDISKNRADSIKLIESMSAAGKTISAVCHAPAVFRHTKAADGSPLVKGKKVTGFTNTEEAAVKLTDIVPFLVEDMLTKNGGLYSKGADWQSYVVTDGKLITGQNPASSEAAAKAVLQQLKDAKSYTAV